MKLRLGLTLLFLLLGIAGAPAAHAGPPDPNNRPGPGASFQVDAGRPDVTDLPIYDDALRLPWQQYALWHGDTSINYGAASPVYAGTRSIELIVSGWGGVSWRKNEVETADGYTALRLAVHGGDAGGQRLNISLGNDAYSEMIQRDLGAYLPGGQVTAGSWLSATVPISGLLAFSQTTFNRINIHGNRSVSQPAVYLDEIALLGRDGPAPPEAELPSGLWVWIDVIPARSREQLFEFAAGEGMTSLWVESEYYLNHDAAALADFSAAASQAGFDVEWLLGYAPWALSDNHGALLDLIDLALAATAGMDAAQRPVAVHLDVEPHSLAEWNSDQQATASQYLDLLAAVDQSLAAAGDPLDLVVDIPFWYDGVTLTWQSQLKPLSEHVLDVVDRAVLMDYRDQAWGNDSIVSHAADEIAYATLAGKQVVIGVETNPPGSQPEKITFYEEGRRVMRSELAAARNHYRGQAGFAGVAVHDYSGLMGLERTPGVAPWLPVSWDTAAARASYDANRDHIDELLPFQYEVEPNGSLRAYVPVDAALLADAQGAGLLVMPTINNDFDPARMTTILNNPISVTQHITNIVDMVLAWDFDGVDIDYESMNASDRDAFSAFMAALAGALHAEGKYLSIAAHPKTSEPGSWSGPQSLDYAALGQVVDRFRLMVYNYSWAGGPAGPIGPIHWAEDVLDFTMSQVDPALIWLGIPFYGYDWASSGVNSVLYSQASDLMATYGVTPTWQTADSHGLVMEPRFSYEAGGVEHEVWYCNGREVWARLRLAMLYDVAGISIWRLGQEDPANWQAIATLRAGQDNRLDLDVDGQISAADLQIVAAHWGLSAGQPDFSRWADLNSDDQVDVLDVVQAASGWE